MKFSVMNFVRFSFLSSKESYLIIFISFRKSFSEKSRINLNENKTLLIVSFSGEDPPETYFYE